MDSLLDLPSAIIGLVVLVVVYSSYLNTTFRTIPHICEEVLEHQPSLAYRYSSPAISRKRSVPFLEATRFHPRPGIIRSFVVSFEIRSSIGSWKLFLHLRSHFLGDNFLSFFGIGSSEEAGIVEAELADVPERVLVARTVGRTLESGTVLGCERPALLGCTDLASSFLEDGRVMPIAGTAGRAWTSDLAMALTGASWLTFHTLIIPLLRGKVRAQ